MAGVAHMHQVLAIEKRLATVDGVLPIHRLICR